MRPGSAEGGSTPFASMASNGPPSIPGAPCSPWPPDRLRGAFQFADMDVPAPEPPGRFSLRLHIYPPLQVLPTHGCLCHSPASLCRSVPNSRVPVAPRALPRFSATTDPSVPLASSGDFPVDRLYNLLASADFAAGRGGFLQLLRVSLSPCCRSHPAGVYRRVSQTATTILPSPSRLQARPPGFRTSRPPLRSLALRPGDSPPSRRWGWSEASEGWFPVPLLSELQGSGFSPGRFPSY